MKIKKDNKVTEWDNNPREMWVWDNDSDDKIAKRKVVYICSYDRCCYPVATVPDGTVPDDSEITCYRFCKEISTETKKRPYKDNYEFITDYLLRFGPNSSDSIRPSIWLRRVDPDTKAIIEFCVDMFVYNHERNPGIDKRRYDGVVVFGCIREMDSIAEDYTYLDGSYVGIEE